MRRSIYYLRICLQPHGCVSFASPMWVFFRDLFHPQSEMAGGFLFVGGSHQAGSGLQLNKKKPHGANPFPPTRLGTGNGLHHLQNCSLCPPKGIYRLNPHACWRWARFGLQQGKQESQKTVCVDILECWLNTQRTQSSIRQVVFSNFIEIFWGGYGTQVN